MFQQYSNICAVPQISGSHFPSDHADVPSKTEVFYKSKGKILRSCVSDAEPLKRAINELKCGNTDEVLRIF